MSGLPPLPTEPSGAGRFCLIMAGDQPMLYHQIALRLALEGFSIIGAAPAAVNAQLGREIDDAGGTFHSYPVFESGDSALIVLESGKAFDPLYWAAQRRIVISPQVQPAASPLWKSAVIQFPQSLAQQTLADIVDQVVFLLHCPPCAHAVVYSPLPDGRHFQRTTRLNDENGQSVEHSEVIPVDGVEVRSSAHGYGVFASRSYRRGEQVLATRGVLLGHQTEHSIQVGLAGHLEPRFPVRLINHSCEPNLGVHTTPQGLPDFHAFRDIQAGEQLTFDYAMTELLHVPRPRQELEFSLECWCGAATCRHQLGYYSTLPAAVKRHYAGYLSNYLLELEAQLDPALAPSAAGRQDKQRP